MNGLDGYKFAVGDRVTCHPKDGNSYDVPQGTLATVVGLVPSSIGIEYLVRFDDPKYGGVDSPYAHVMWKEELEHTDVPHPAKNVSEVAVDYGFPSGRGMRRLPVVDLSDRAEWARTLLFAGIIMALIVLLTLVGYFVPPVGFYWF